MPVLGQGRGQGQKKSARQRGQAPEAPAAGRGAPIEHLIAPEDECYVCFNAYEQPTITSCGHWFCR